MLCRLEGSANKGPLVPKIAAPSEATPKGPGSSRRVLGADYGISEWAKSESVCLPFTAMRLHWAAAPHVGTSKPMLPSSEKLSFQPQHAHSRVRKEKAAQELVQQRQMVPR